MRNRIRIVITSLLVLPAIAGSIMAHAQKIAAGDSTELVKKEDSLKLLSQAMVFNEEAPERFRSDSTFTRTFVRALKTRNSFFFPFDSLNISKLYSPDSTFRIFTWQMKRDEYVLLQKGAIQMNTPDGSLKLFPLFDYSMFTPKPGDSVRTRNNWIGAIYYRIVMKEYDGRKYYTLLGFDDFTVSSNKKWMEVLHFENGEPVFGGPFISFKEDSVKRPTMARYSIEYKKEARTFFNYDPELDMIIVDHLVSDSDEPEKKSTYVPDGDYEAFQWKNGQWVHVNKLFNQRLKDGEFPRDATILDDAGNADEHRLEEASQRNIDKKNAEKDKDKKEIPKKKG